MLIPPPEYLVKCIFSRRIGGPQRAAPFLGAQNVSLPACGHRPDSWSPPRIPGQGRFFGTPWGPASTLLHASWPQILVCQHTGHRPDSRSPKIPGQGHFSGRPGGPRQHAALCLLAPNFGQPARWAQAEFSAPPEYQAKPVFPGRPGAPATVLLRASWPQICSASTQGVGWITDPPKYWGAGMQ